MASDPRQPQESRQPSSSEDAARIRSDDLPEERYADEYVGRRIQPFWIEGEARKIANSNFIVNGRFKSHAVRDGNLITGQQQYSGAAAAHLVHEALGV